jgi:hypothetical protein
MNLLFFLTFATMSHKFNAARALGCTFANRHVIISLFYEYELKGDVMLLRKHFLKRRRVCEL